MSESCSLIGSVESKPLVGNPSGQPSIIMPFSEKVILERSYATSMELLSDPVVAVSLGPLTNVNVLFMRTVGGKVRLRITTTDGATQAISVDPTCFILSKSVPITAIDVMRYSTYDTTVFLFLGEIPA